MIFCAASRSVLTMTASSVVYRASIRRLTHQAGWRTEARSFLVWTLRAGCLLFNYWILSNPDRLPPSLPYGMNRYTGGTILLALVNAVLFATWPRSSADESGDRVRLRWSWIGA